MPNVEVYLENRMTAEDIIAMQADHILIATGATWKNNGQGRYNPQPLEEFGPANQVFTPDDIMAGNLPSGPTLIYDDDHYYMASVIAELLRKKGIPVTFVTPEPIVSSWGDMTSEQSQIQRRLIETGTEIITSHSLSSFNGTEAQIECVYTSSLKPIQAEAVVTVTMRSPNEELYYNVQKKLDEQSDYQPKSLTRIGDCEAPAIIAAAVFSGHRYARELDTEVDVDNRIKYDRVFYEDG